MKDYLTFKNLRKRTPGSQSDPLSMDRRTASPPSSRLGREREAAAEPLLEERENSGSQNGSAVDRTRTHSPSHRLLGDVESPESSIEGERCSGAKSHGGHGLGQSSQHHQSYSCKEYEERVIITSDLDRRRESGDGDSGISELTGEEHPLSETRDKPYVMQVEKEESLIFMILQIIIPFFFAGCGMMAAGLLLDTVQHWSVYVGINELFILVPALLGLKGNLEMTLASRLSTAANVGEMKTWSNRWRLTWGNLSLIQIQALVVAGLATVLSIVLGHDRTPFRQLLLGASSMGAASIASAILGIIMIGVVIISHYLHINPDNVATPIAASLGDLVTLGLLSLIAQGFYDTGRQTVISPVLVSGNRTNGTDATPTTMNSTISPASIIASSSTVLVLLLLLIPVTFLLAYKNYTTRSVLIYGWFPVISAMFISSGGGWILSKAVSKWKGIAIYSPIINGVGGNLVAVQASRISTSLHQVGSPGQEVVSPLHKYHGPHRTFFCGNKHARTARVLVCIAIPGSLAFLFIIHAISAGHTTQSFIFYVGYLICALLQVIILLLVADWMVHFTWGIGYDPDNIVIPFMTALGDLLGTGLLSLGFLIMWYLGDRDEDVGE